MDQRCVLASTKVLQLDFERVYLPENLARNLQKVDVTATLQNRARRRRVLAYMTTRSGFNTGTTYLQWYTQHTSTVTVQHIARRAAPHPPTDRSDLTDRGRPVPHEQSRNRPNAHDHCRLSATRDGPDSPQRLVYFCYSSYYPLYHRLYNHAPPLLYIINLINSI